MTKSAILLFLLLSAAVFAARANLGETLDQCKQKYGDPVETKQAPNVDEMILFKKDGIKYAIGFKAGKSVILIIGKESTEKLGEEEVQQFLAANSQGSHWKKSIRPSGNDIWMREDNLAVAQFDPLFGILTLVDSKYMNAEMARKKAAAATAQ